MPHVPPVHAGVPLVELQVLPQEPQLPVEVAMLVSQPSTTLLLQSSNPELHAIWQLPPLQAGRPWLALQPWPQAPQLAVEALVLTSHPLLTLLSQLA